MTTTYQRTLPDASAETLREAYTFLSGILVHLQPWGTDLVRIEIVPSAIVPGEYVVEVELTNPVDDPDQRAHVGLGDPAA